MKSEKGQSLVEIIFSVGVISLVIVGVVSLVVNVIGTKNSSLRRKKAAELGETVVEDLLNQKKSNPGQFWQLVSVGETTLPGFDGYVYNVGYTEVNNITGCQKEKPTDMAKCANAVINIIWDSGKNNLSVTRFFSRTI